jgi:hypothetical protein
MVEAGTDTTWAPVHQSVDGHFAGAVSRRTRRIVATP